ncbi:MAG: benzoyl-CoA reductase subunit C [Acidobacteria bacterium]|nr:benzoyl-CoA reductase subunit C [Acidobacteriota bacterium]
MKHQRLDALARADRVLNDLSYGYVQDWLGRGADRHAVGYLPIYAPREIIAAAGMIPVGVFGAGDALDIVKGDAYFQSYICHIPRSVIEMALDGRFATFSAFIFPAICDVIRNLSGMWQMNFPDQYVKYLDYPQNFDPEVGGRFYRRELEDLLENLVRISGREVSDAELHAATARYNENRRLLDRLYDARSRAPHNFPMSEVYRVVRAGSVLTVDDHNRLILDYLAAAEAEPLPDQDRIRVYLVGAFCEQPPLGLLKTLEQAGCALVGDDLLLGMRFIRGDVATEGDPLDALVAAYLTKCGWSSAVYDGDNPREDKLVEDVRACKADGVIFCCPSFCDPALLDRPMLQKRLDEERVPYASFQYSENTGQFQVIREQAGTFSDSIKLWE